jgi:hypothetical protein
MRVVEKSNVIANKFKIAALTLTVFGPLAIAQDGAGDNGSGSRPGFGGPNATENQMADDYETWHDWKKSLKDDHGFGFSVDYTGVFLSANETFDSDTASGGILRAYGAWEFLDQATGALVWKFEHRHK